MDLYANLCRTLSAAGVENARGEALLLLSFVTATPYDELRRTVLLASSGPSFVTDDETLISRALACAKRRAEGEPLQYITGETDFYGRPFYTAKEVLIPRFDTEIVAERAIDAARRFAPGARVCDVCCGSGCIGLTVALETDAHVTLCDISEPALALCKRNARRHGVVAEMVKTDVLCDVPAGTFDVVVSNPPYIPTDVLPTLSREVRREPTLALDGGEDGLVFYRRLAKIGREMLTKGGTLVLEMGAGQRADIEAILRENGYAELAFFKDLGGVERAAVAVNTAGKESL